MLLTWEKLGDDLVLHNNMRDLRLDLDGFPGQLGEDLLTEQNVLSGLQLHVPRLGSYHSSESR